MKVTMKTYNLDVNETSIQNVSKIRLKRSCCKAIIENIFNARVAENT